MKLALLSTFLFALVIGCATPRAATPEEQAQAIEREVWSPYCPGRLLIDCTTQQARDLRSNIETRLRRGESRGEVLDWIRRNHGDEALARPEARGTGLVLWLVPAAIFAIGAVTVGSLVKRWSRASRTVPQPKGEHDAHT